MSFLVLDLTQTWGPLNENILTITIVTDVECYVTLYWTDKLMRLHKRSTFKRGIVALSNPDYCFVQAKPIEQVESGDTLVHTFTWPNWQYCQWKYFVFTATIAGEPSPSQWGIFTKHQALEHPFKQDLIEQWTWLGCELPDIILGATEEWTWLGCEAPPLIRSLTEEWTD